MKYLLVLPLFGLLALLPACGGGCKKSSCQTSCCDTQSCQAPAITEVTPELAPVTVVEETVQATNAPISGAKEEFDDEDLEDSDEFK